VVSHFPNRVYNGLEDLAETIMNPANFLSSRVNVTVKGNSDFALLEPHYVYTDIIKPNLVGDSYVRLLTTLHFPSNIGYNRFNYTLYRPIEHSSKLQRMVRMCCFKIVIFQHCNFTL